MKEWNYNNHYEVHFYFFFLFFFCLVHAAWEPFCLFLAVIGRQQATTRNPPSLLSTGDYQFRKRKTGQTSRGLSSFMTCLILVLHEKLLLQLLQLQYTGGQCFHGAPSVPRWRSARAEGSTPQIFTAAPEGDGRAPWIPSAQAEGPLSIHIAELHSQLKELCPFLGLIIVLIRSQLRPAVGETVARKGKCDSVSPL